MKIDVEGFETAVIRGTQATISRCKPIRFVEASTLDALESLTKQKKQ